MSSLPGYTTGAVLHVGARTRVFRGVRDSDGRPVIIKALRCEHPSPREHARLRHEFELLRRFDDDRITRALELVDRGPQAALILEDIGGESLRPRIPDDGVDVSEFLDLAVRIAEALEVIHAQRVLHMDIKPDNIIVTADDMRVAITDFSIASVLTEERPLTPEVLEGSLSYISPEQTGRMNRPVDYRSDFYSLGVTFYELLTGALPFRAQDPLELVHAHIARRPVPPDLLREEIPPLLSRIVLRLLEKNAEDRYQSLAGLLGDLRRAREADDDDREIVDFPLGLLDRSERFSLSTTLVGREAETALVMSAFDRACAGGNELILIGGPGGIGKSALVRELERPLAERRGAFVAGKFDALDHGAPYSALARALRELVLRILGTPEDRLREWRRALTGALGQNAQLVIQMIPELGTLLGPQPPVPKMPPAETANRFHAALRQLIGAFARDDHPLAIFLDDLQWADLATLTLIEDLVGGLELAHVLWIGTFRDSEVSSDHPLARMRAALIQAGASLTEKLLAPLSQANVGQIIAGTLHMEVDAVAPLTGAVHQSSEGNPFFVRALLEMLHEESVLRFDRALSRWTWDMSQIEAAALPDDVVALVTQRIQSLAPATRELLRLAAGIGARFELHLLCHLAGVDPKSALDDLWGALRAGLVRPIGEDYKFVGDEVHVVEFEFTHDRVQQAAYGLLGDDARLDLHVRIGRRMLADQDATEEPFADAELFTLAGHLSQATARITARAEQKRITAMMIRAAERAKLSTAYEAACGFLDAGARLLPASPWIEEPTLTAQLMREQVECEYLAGRPERAVTLFGPLLVNTRTVIGKADLYALRAVLETNRGDLAAALDAGRRGLALFGFRLPATATTLSVLRAFTRFQLLRGRAPAATILDLPLLGDDERRAELRVMMAMIAAAYFTDTNLASVLLLRIANLSLRHGLSDVTAYGLIGAGLVMAGAFGRYAAAYELSQVARRLNDRFANAELSAKINLFAASFTIPWVRPFAEVKLALREAAETAAANGDIIFGVYASVTEIFMMALDGSPLEHLSEQALALMPLLRRRRLEDQTATLSFMTELFGELLRDPEGAVDDSGLTRLIAQLDEQRTPLAMFYQHLYLALLRYMEADYDRAYAAITEALARSKAAFGSPFIADLYFYECLILTRRAPASKARQRRADKGRIKAGLKALTKWSRTAPSNFSARLALVRGEAARRDGDDAAALRLYNDAIDLAREQRAPQIEAFAAECALRFSVDRGLPIVARAFFREAVAAYRRWGAEAKIAWLAAEFDDLVVEPMALDLADASPSSAATMTRATSVVALDLETVNRAARAISSELEMDRLLTRLLTLLLENAAARRGVLLLNVDGQLRVEAEAVCDDAGIQVEVGQAQTLEEFAALPASVINLVVRTGSDVIIADAAQDPLHSADPLLRARKVRSLLCTPIFHQGALSCVLYLENELSPGVFTHRRLSVIRQLAAQVAISLTNARLYDSLNDARVAALAADRVKTRFLMNMSHELRTPLNAILGFTELIAESFAAGDTSTVEADLQSVHRAGMRLLRSVSSILELTQIETDAREIHPVAIDLNVMLPKLVSAFQDAAAVHDNTLRIQVEAPLPSLTTDESMLRYVLTTLLDNACRFTEGGSVTVRAHEVSVDDAPWLELSVADTGHGIPEDALPKLFTAFSQADDSPTRRYDGTGVSLAVTAHFCERLGGSVRVSSEPGAGSVFSVLLPRQR